MHKTSLSHVFLHKIFAHVLEVKCTALICGFKLALVSLSRGT